MTVDRIPLDPSRVDNARRRVEASLSVIKHHESRIVAERAKVQTIIRTWGLCPADADVCCGNPTDCEADK